MYPDFIDFMKIAVKRGITLTKAILSSLCLSLSEQILYDFDTFIYYTYCLEIGNYFSVIGQIFLQFLHTDLKTIYIVFNPLIYFFLWKKNYYSKCLFPDLKEYYKQMQVIYIYMYGTLKEISL